MPTSKQLKNHTWVLQQLKQSQEAEHDMREQVREAHLFVDKRDGMWEPYWAEQNKNKPRYSFDLCNPIIDQVAHQIERQDYDIRITPGGGEATEDVAATYDGIIRNIEMVSDAKSIYTRAARDMITGGLSGWRVVQKYVDGDSFDQDLAIERIGNYVDRVWHGPHEEPDASDADMCWILTGMTKEDYEAAYPDRDVSASVESDRSNTAYFYRRDLIMVGEFLYLKEQEQELVLMDNGNVYEVNDDFKAVQDELMQMGVMEVSRRKRKAKLVCSRLFDNNGWIKEAQETVFEDSIPVIPVYGNFKVFEDKITYWGVVEKLIDAQRVFNYSMSREIEEGALAPRAKYWMTTKQAEGHEEQLATMNTNADPVQFYEPDPEAPGAPQQNGGAQINPGLRNISQAMQNIVGQAVGMFAANMGDNPNLQSGVAIQNLQDRGDGGNNKYVSALVESMKHTAKILIKAIPKVYTPGRQLRIMKEDGSYDMTLIGEVVIDNQTGRPITLNDLSQGKYDVVRSAAPSFKNRQSETVTALTEVGKIDPSVIELGGDILLNNIASPGMDQLSERKREMLFKQGLIPETQLTDDERGKLQQMQQQPPPEDPNMILAKAEHEKAMADHIEAQTKSMQVQHDAQIKEQETKIRAFEAETKRMEAQIKHAQALADIKGKTASAAKALSEAEAQDLENDMAISGVMAVMERVKNG